MLGRCGVEGFELFGREPDSDDLHRFRTAAGAPASATLEDIDVVAGLGLAALHLSEDTVKTHVTSVLTKLGLRDRLQAVILAYESGYIRPH
jgi:FMN phosphatase YigB (HAD superfamily)